MFFIITRFFYNYLIYKLHFNPINSVSNFFFFCPIKNQPTSMLHIVFIILKHILILLLYMSVSKNCSSFYRSLNFNKRYHTPSISLHLAFYTYHYSFRLIPIDTITFIHLFSLLYPLLWISYLAVTTILSKSYFSINSGFLYILLNVL